MHDSHKIRTLLACIDDLTKAVQEMSVEAHVHQADQDLLLYRSRLFYEAVLCMPTADAVAPLALAPSAKDDRAEGAASGLMNSFTDALEHTIEAAVEQAIGPNQKVEVDLTLETTHEAETTAVEEVFVVMAEEASGVAAAVLEVAAGPADAVEEAVPAADAATAEAATPTSPEAIPAPAAKTPANSMAFSLSGIIERSGNSHLVMAHLKLKPIDDLKSGVGLNEKFLFIRELFGNDHLAYAEAIEKLNAAPTLGAAEKILAAEVLPQQQWDLETEAALSFLHLIFRRFATS